MTNKPASPSPFAGMGLTVDQPTRMPIVCPRTMEPMVDADGNEGFIMLMSSDSHAGREYDRKLQIDRIGRRQQTKSKIVEQAEAEQTEKLVALTKGPWHLVGFDGQPIDLPCNTANARALYSDPATVWLRDQVQLWVTDRANFLPGPAPTSSTPPEDDSGST